MADLQGIDQSLLIPKIRRMIRAVGLPATVSVLETLGGTSLELPQGHRYRKRGGVLEQLIGQHEAQAFHAEFANEGRRMLLPKVDKILLQLRNRQICEEAGELSVRDQALRYRLTTRQIEKIRRKGGGTAPRVDRDQLDLFADQREGV